MDAFWGRICWHDVVVGAVVWALFLGECVALDHTFPSTVPGCVATAALSCWDVTGLLYALLSVPFWYVAWARLLRPCPWQLRWATPLVVSYTAYRLAALGDWYGWAEMVALALGYLAASTAMSAFNAMAAERRT